MYSEPAARQFLPGSIRNARIHRVRQRFAAFHALFRCRCVEEGSNKPRNKNAVAPSMEALTASAKPLESARAAAGPARYPADRGPLGAGAGSGNWPASALVWVAESLGSVLSRVLVLDSAKWAGKLPMMADPRRHPADGLCVESLSPGRRRRWGYQQGPFRSAAPKRTQAGSPSTTASRAVVSRTEVGEVTNKPRASNLAFSSAGPRITTRSGPI